LVDAFPDEGVLLKVRPMMAERGQSAIFIIARPDIAGLFSPTLVIARPEGDGFDLVKTLTTGPTIRCAVGEKQAVQRCASTSSRQPRRPAGSRV